jgi:hypothetical protein
MQLQSQEVTAQLQLKFWKCLFCQQNNFYQNNYYGVTDFTLKAIFLYFTVELYSHMASYKVNFAGVIDPGVFNVQQSTRG